MKQKKISSTIFAYALVFALMSCSGYAAQPTIDLDSAANFVILSKSGITDVPISAIVGNIGTYPITGAAIGVPCSEVTGTIFDRDNAYTGGGGGSTACRVTNAALLNTARIDMEAAYTDAVGRTPPDQTELGAGDISGLILTPGLYKWSTGLLINSGTPPDTSGVTLDCQGNSSGVFIFQIAQDLTVGSGAVVTLKGGCQANNIFWQVGGQALLGTTSVFNGNILSQSLIAMNTNAALCGRALAQTAVTLIKNHISSTCSSINSSIPVLTNITLSPPSANITVGSILQLNGVCVDQFGGPIAPNTTFVSSNSSVAIVNATSGLVSALAPGSTTITAVCAQGLNATSLITVRLGPKTIPLMDEKVFVLLTVSTLLVGLYGFKKYQR